MLHRILTTITLTLWCPFQTIETKACSVRSGYIRPTNYELVKGAEAIVLARATTFEKKAATPGGVSVGMFGFKILERIQGECREEFISTEGDTDVHGWGYPTDFSFTKADYGPCNPTDYQLNSNYVLFLKRFKGNGYVGGPPFSRINVMVEGTNAPWIRAVREYARIASLKNYEKEKTALLNARSSAPASERGYSRALADDIDDHFNKPTPAKSFLDLRVIYDRTADLEKREQVLWACADEPKLEAKDFFRGLMTTGEWLQHIGPVCTYVAEAKLTGFHQKFASVLATNRVEYERRWILMALAGSTEYSEKELMQRILESISAEEIVVLSDWFVRYPSPPAIRHVAKLASKDYPEHFDLTLMLAGMGDSNVVHWAKEFVKQPGDQAWLGVYVFANSPLPEADQIARQIIKNGDSDQLVWLVQAYGDSRSTQRLDRIKEAVKTTPKSQKLIYWLRRTLNDWAYQGNKEAEKLLSELPVVESEK